jgi:hypothetical protein
MLSQKTSILLKRLQGPSGLSGVAHATKDTGFGAGSRLWGALCAVYLF